MKIDKKLWWAIYQRMLKYNFHRNSIAENDTNWYVNSDCEMRVFYYITLLDNLRNKIYEKSKT